jgi:serine/threonine protein phosphatase 1
MMKTITPTQIYALHKIGTLKGDLSNCSAGTGVQINYSITINPLPMARYAIADIHGCLATFNRLLEKIELTQADILYLLGDYIHRGPDSIGVILRILELRKAGYKVRCLLGNHEDMILDDLNRAATYASPYLPDLDPFVRSVFARYGKIPEDILTFLTTLPTAFFLDDYILVHGGFDFTHPDPFAPAPAHSWIRDWYGKIDYNLVGDRIILHGHTPISSELMAKQYKVMLQYQYLDLDGGCVFGLPDLYVREGYGNLYAFDMDKRELICQEVCEEISGDREYQAIGR